MIWIGTGIRSVLLDPTSGAISGLHHHGILVDMTTSEPSLAVEISAAASSKDCFSIDAPVSGGDLGLKREGWRYSPEGTSRWRNILVHFLPSLVKLITWVPLEKVNSRN